jgi:hypothetical protein
MDLMLASLENRLNLAHLIGKFQIKILVLNLDAVMLLMYKKALSIYGNIYPEINRN